jgi:hypothetical protein
MSIECLEPYLMQSYVYMAWDVMILMGANPLQGPLEGVGPENQDFFGS